MSNVYNKTSEISKIIISMFKESPWLTVTDVAKLFKRLRSRANVSYLKGVSNVKR